MDERSNRGAIEAELYMLITGITTHLTAITAYPLPQVHRILTIMPTYLPKPVITLTRKCKIEKLKYRYTISSFG
ncbi:MAG: hypothetical protein U9O90_05650 [Euryarchaeota archaeon]|nr:hypothetical protein [Euryarchaeota archaeon]